MRTIVFIVVEAGVLCYALHPVWRRWDSTTKTRLGRTTAGMVAAGLLMLAFNDATAKVHYVCTQEAGNGDERECVGDYERVAGPNYGGAFLWTLLAVIPFRMSMNEPDKQAAVAVTDE